MKKSIGASILVLLLALAACGPPVDQSSHADSAAQNITGDAGRGLGTNAGKALLLIGWNMTAYVRPDAITTLVREQASTCIKAGVQNCTVMGATASNENGAAIGTLQVQADPVWLEGFRDQIAKDVTGAEGKITSDGLDVDNVSTEVRDLENRARTQNADAAGQVVDASAPASNLPARQQARDLRTQTKRQTLTMNYTSKPSIMSSVAMERLKSALSGSTQIAASAIAVVIYISAVALPLGLALSALIALRNVSVARGWGVWRPKQAARPPEGLMAYTKAE